jgi:hypothetical protein
MRLSIPVVICVSLVVIGCGRKIEPVDIQGEWRAENAFFYLNVKGDSLSYWGTCGPIYRPMRDAHGIIKYNDLIGAWGSFRSPIGTFPFRIGRCGDLIVQTTNTSRDTLGRLALCEDSLSIGSSERFKLRLYPMERDTSIHLQKIQFSASGCLGPCESYDLELREGHLLFVGSADSIETGVRKNRHAYAAIFDSSSFAECRSTIQKANLRGPHQQFERWVELGGDVQIFGMTVFYNDSTSTFLGDGTHFPPALAPVIKFVKDPKTRYRLVPIDTTIVFHSRLRFFTSLNDSLMYLEDIDNKHYRAARFPGGEDSLQSYLHRRLNELASDWHGTYCVDVVIGRDGRVQEVRRPDFQQPPEFFPLLARLLMESPKWQVPVYDGRPISVTEFICFYNEAP